MRRPDIWGMQHLGDREMGGSGRKDLERNADHFRLARIGDCRVELEPAEQRREMKKMWKVPEFHLLTRFRHVVGIVALISA